MAARKRKTALALRPRGLDHDVADLTHWSIGPVPGCTCQACEKLGKSPLGAFRAAGARMVVGRQVDDVVTEAVKESYAAGVAAALDGLRAWAEAVDATYDGPGTTRDFRAVDRDELELEIGELWKRLATWKVPS